MKSWRAILQPSAASDAPPYPPYPPEPELSPRSGGNGGNGGEPEGGAERSAGRARAADLDAFEERAAIAEHDGGLSREEAERRAATAQGFASPADLRDAAAEGWRLRLEGLRGRVRSPEGRRAVEAALRFVAEGWAAKAAALGWPELELFGADPRAPWARLDRLGAAYAPFPPFAVTAGAILYGKAGDAPLRRWRGSQADGAAPAWEAET